MKRLIAGALAVAVVALSACGGSQQQPNAGVTPAPTDGLPSATAAPSAIATPSQEELSAMAERTYRAFFDEWTRLERVGGAEEPTPALLEYGGGPYLASVMTLLREQSSSRTVVSGAAFAYVKPSPGGNFDGVDPRLTLKVCEDHSNGTYTRDGVTKKGDILAGVVYLSFDGAQAKVIGGDTKAVDRCAF